MSEKHAAVNCMEYIGYTRVFAFNYNIMSVMICNSVTGVGKSTLEELPPWKP